LERLYAEKAIPHSEERYKGRSGTHPGNRWGLAVPIQNGSPQEVERKFWGSYPTLSYPPKIKEDLFPACA